MLFTQEVQNMINASIISAIAKHWKTVYVDSVYGNDATWALDDQNKPFLTRQAAVTAASSWYTVVTRPGTYDETVTLKAGVNFFDYPWVVLTRSVAAWNIFTDNNVNVGTIYIDGYAQIDAVANNNVPFLLQNAGSNLNARFSLIACWTTSTISAWWDFFLSCPSTSWTCTCTFAWSGKIELRGDFSTWDFTSAWATPTWKIYADVKNFTIWSSTALLYGNSTTTNVNAGTINQYWNVSDTVTTAGNWTVNHIGNVWSAASVVTCVSMNTWTYNGKWNLRAIAPIFTVVWIVNTVNHTWTITAALNPVATCGWWTTGFNFNGNLTNTWTFDMFHATASTLVNIRWRGDSWSSSQRIIGWTTFNAASTLRFFDSSLSSWATFPVITLWNNNLILNGSSLVAWAGAANSIVSTIARSIKIYWNVVGNLALDPNITVLVNPTGYITDTNVT